MLQDRIVFVNGEFVAWSEAKVHIMCHSFGRGSAIFEVLSLHDTSFGPAVFRLDEHIHRLYRTASFLGMELPTDKKRFEEDVLETVRRNRIRKGVIKIICFYPQISFEILPPQKRLDTSIFVLEPSEDLGRLELPVEKGTTACLSRWRKLDPETVPVEAKAAANYLNGMVARMEGKKLGFDHAVMLDTQGFIAEGGTESVFLVKDGVLMTPSLGTVLQSISRASLLEVARAAGMPTLEARLKPELLSEADEIFLSCTPAKTLPVRKMGARVFEKVPGPVCGRLIYLMDEILAGKNDRFKHWLFPIS